MALKRLVYASRRTPSIDEAVLNEIIETSQKNNRRDGVTGVLLYDDKRFVQFLEGEHDPLARCYLRIALDDRHTDMQIAAMGDSALRMFSDWDMKLAPAPRNQPSLTTVWRKIMAEEPEDRLPKIETVLFDLLPM